MIPLLRTLTRKSKFKIGKLADDTVQELLDRKKYKDLRSCYYRYTSINYTEDILKELGITGDLVIEKPGANPEMYFKHFKPTKHHQDYKRISKN